MSQAPPSSAHVLVIDDEPDLRTLYALTLLREGYRVDSASDLAQARELLAATRFDAVITDMRLPDGLGLEVLESLSQSQRPERCIVMTAFGSAENAVEALKAGAFDYLTKPVDLRQFRSVVAQAVQGGARARPQAATAAPAGARPGGAASATERSSAAQALARLVGNSPAMREVKERIARVARGMAPVLVRGESGTGKELVARAIHACSHREAGPFVAVNCGAIPEQLLEAEFFGARKGAYTGSTHDREGYFQAARGGTLFLDEIGDLPVAMQSKLLRAIQERQVRAIGSTQEDAVDVRIVSATHRDLAADVQAGRFRQDLYYRLNVIDITVPPVRERPGDLPLLAQAVLSRIAREAGLRPPPLSQRALAQLAQLPLAGNVRELENLLHRSLALADPEALALELPADCLAAAARMPLATAAQPDGGGVTWPAATPVAWAEPAAGQASPGPAPMELPSDLQAWLDQQEREILVRALRDSGFNRTAAAQRLGLSLRQIRYRIARLAIAAPGDEGTERSA